MSTRVAIADSRRDRVRKRRGWGLRAVQGDGVQVWSPVHIAPAESLGRGARLYYVDSGGRERLFGSRARWSSSGSTQR